MATKELSVLVLWEKVTGEILDRTVKFPKHARFTFAGRIDNLTLDILERTWAGDLLNSALSKVVDVKASSEEAVTLSDKCVIAVSDEASLNIGASEKINIGAHIEQTVAKKHSVNVGPFTEINMGPRKVKDMTTQITKHQIKTNTAVAMWRMKAPVSGIGFKMANVAARIWVWK